MSRVISHSRRSVPPPPPSTTNRWDWQNLPPWLASFICHSTLLVVAALLIGQAGPPPKSEMVIQWKQGSDVDAGGGGEPGDLGAPTKDEPEWAAEVADLAEPLPEVDPAQKVKLSEWGAVSAELDAASPLAALHGIDDGTIGDGLGGDGGGRGGGHGRGVGTGTGDGLGPGVGRTSMFGLVGEGSNFVYVFDRSESMNSVFTLTSEGRSVSITPLAAAKAELIQSLEHLGDSNKFQLIFYNDEPLMFTDAYGPNGVFTATPDAKALATAFITALPGQGNTNHLGALEMALRSNPDVLFLLTDGEAKDDPTPAQLRRLIKICRRIGTKVNLIHFAYEPRTSNPLIGLAQATHGDHVSISIRGLVHPEW